MSALTDSPRNKTSFIFVIDTNAYAGNFERELIAYISGRIGECEVGEDSAQTFYEEMGLNDEGWTGFSVRSGYEDLNSPFSFLQERPDEHGCMRPATIWQNGDGKYDSVACFMEREPTKEEIAILVGRTKKWEAQGHESCKTKVEILGFRLIEEKLTYSQIWSG